MEKLFLPPVSTVAKIEDEFKLFFQANGLEKGVDVDFRDVMFFEPSTSSAYLIGILNTLKTKGTKFQITPPNSNGIKVLLYTWRFFEVLEEVTGIPVSEFCPQLEKDYNDGLDIIMNLTPLLSSKLTTLS